jgi:hypothetical protein
MRSPVRHAIDDGKAGLVTAQVVTRGTAVDADFAVDSWSEATMKPQESSKNPEKPHEEIAEHIAGAHHLLQSLREKLAMDKHPELEEAIQRLEMALSILTVKTGGML